MTNIVIIIGSGFDLNLGLRTSYTDFINSLQFKELVEAGNSLAVYLKNKSDMQNWIDIENELKIYSGTVFKDRNRKIFKTEYKSLCNALCNYINKIDYSLIKKDSSAHQMINYICRMNTNNRITIYDFNYTESVKKIMEDIGATGNIITHTKVHGSAINNSIIFGVEDKAYINNDDIFLCKSASIYYDSNININRILEEAEEIKVIGHSLGETDHLYFEHLFRTQADRNAKSKKMLFTYHDDDGWDGIMKQLRNLSMQNLADLKSYNEINYMEI